MSKRWGRGMGFCALLVVAAAIFMLSSPASAKTEVGFAGSDRGRWGVGTHECGSALPVWVETSGIATHLGRYAYSSHECASLTTGTYAGSFTISSANGDTVVGRYAGTFTVDGAGTIHYEQTNTITGGSGRFSGVSGSFDVSGLAYADGADVQTLSGALSRIGGM
jgi:hypothetical protein